MPDSQTPGVSFGSSPGQKSPQGSFSMNDANSSGKPKTNQQGGLGQQSPKKDGAVDFSKSFSSDVESFVKTPASQTSSGAEKKPSPSAMKNDAPKKPLSDMSSAPTLQPLPQKKGRGMVGIVIGGIVLVVLVGGGIALYAFRDSLGIVSTGMSGDSDRLAQIESSIETNNQLISDNLSQIQSIQDQIGERLNEDDFVSKADYAQDKDDLETYLRLEDSDSDGLSDYDEVVTYGTDPQDADTDDDGFSDGDEVANGFNPAGEGSLDGQDVNTDENTTPGTAVDENASFGDGAYVGSFLLTDVEVSSNDIKVDVEGDVVTGSFTYEYEGNPYRVDFEGDLTENTSNEEVFVRSTGTLVTGSVSEDISFDISIAQTEGSDEFTGVIEFVESNQAYLANQEGTVNFASSADNADANSADDTDSDGEGFSINTPRLRSIIGS